MTLVSEKWATAEEKVDVGEGGVPEVVDGSRRVSEEGPHETVQAMETDFVCSASVIVTVRGRLPHSVFALTHLLDELQTVNATRLCESHIDRESSCCAAGCRRSVMPPFVFEKIRGFRNKIWVRLRTEELLGVDLWDEVKLSSIFGEAGSLWMRGLQRHFPANKLDQLTTVLLRHVVIEHRRVAFVLPLQIGVI